MARAGNDSPSRSTWILYVEGGGDTGKLQMDLRRAFSEFLSFLPRKPRIAVGGGRGQVFDDFRNGAQKSPDTVHVILIDSEGIVNSNPKKHVLDEFGSEHVNDLPEQHFHLMVQMMEAWLVADPSAIRNAFPNDAKTDELKKLQNIETIAKERLMELMKAATGGKYEENTKRKYGARVLGFVDATIVADAKRLPHGHRFIEAMKEFAK